MGVTKTQKKVQRTAPASVAVGNRRLLKLAAFLEKLPRKRFLYETWVGVDWGGKQNLSCGTTACALGWACSMPEFRRLGAFLTLAGVPSVDHEDNDTHCGCSERAAEHLFGLNVEEHDELFIPRAGEEHATAKYVAKKIRRFVERRS